MPPRPTTILGIFDGTHDASAALVRDGRLLVACSEERFVRRKGAGGWPGRSIQACLDGAGSTTTEVDAIAVGGVGNPNPGLRMLRPLQRAWHLESKRFYTEESGLRARLDSWLQFDSPFPRMRSDSFAGRTMARGLSATIAHQAGFHPPGGVHLYDHHLCHAASAYHTSGWDQALVITADGLGDGLCLAVFRAEAGALERLAAMPFPHSYGLLYATLTGFLGFQPFRHEGKLMGLAARGEADAVDLPFPFEGPANQRRFTRRLGTSHRSWLEPLRRHRREDVCAWLQRGIERDLVGLLSHWLQHTGLHRVALAGGLFGNVRLTAAMADLPQVEAVWVFPNMGDGGLAVGAALHHHVLSTGSSLPRIEHAFLGPTQDPRDTARAEAVLTARGCTLTQPADLAHEVAKALADDQIVACHRGRMEFGPRALGHRSILASAMDPAVTARLNRRLGRSDFMPFAPILLVEDAERWLEDVPTVRHAATFMTTNLRARRALVEACTAAVHCDGSVRPQLVNPRQHPFLHAVLLNYRQITARAGREVPALINTSFNRHEEPIVHSAKQAATTFLAAGLDRLVVGDHLASAPGQREP